MTENKLTTVIPAYNADLDKLARLLHTIAMQTPCDVIIVSDGDKKKDEYRNIAGSIFDNRFRVNVINCTENLGPGGARQKGLEMVKTPYVNFCDADDLLASPLIYENAIKVLDNDKSIVCASYCFLQPNDEMTQFLPHMNDMIWTFGKFYRVDFLKKYNVGFPMYDRRYLRANEDTSYNKCIQLLANERERVVFFKDAAYIWMPKEDSITRVKYKDDLNQYNHDQCFCGWLLSTTLATQHARKYRPFSGQILQDIATTMIQAYFYYQKCLHEAPFFAPQQWYYIKKFYHEQYSELADKISDEALAEVYSVISAQNGQNMIHIIPSFGIREYFDKLKETTFNPDEIYDIWADMYKEDPEALERNVKCGVMPKNYWRKSTNVTIAKKKKK